MERPHAVLIPYPTASHVNPMLELAKVLHAKGFYITFVSSQCSHGELLRNGAADAFRGLDNFRFEVIADGVTSEEWGSPDQVLKVRIAIWRNCPGALRELLLRLGRRGGSADVDVGDAAGAPPVSCVVSNFLMDFAHGVAEELGVPELVFWTTSACGFMASVQLSELVRRGYVPLRDESCLTNGYLDTVIDWIPGMGDVRLRDISSFVKTTDPDDMPIKFELEEVNYASRAWGLILNTFDRLESQVLDALRLQFPRIYTLGPLGNLADRLGGPLSSKHLTFWQRDSGCAQWLDAQGHASVLYVSFGSLTVLKPHQLTEFAWGLADSGHRFLWILRPNLVDGGPAALPDEFVAETRDRSYLASWCDQRSVLSHPAVAGFLTHSGWNSTLESVTAGVPMACWPGFADQYMNCRFACKEWGIGLEIDGEVKREQVRDLVRELMEGEKGKEMRKRAERWKEAAGQAAGQDGTSRANLERLVKDLKLYGVDE